MFERIQPAGSTRMRAITRMLPITQSGTLVGFPSGSQETWII
jgi:hypothetical protein